MKTSGEIETWLQETPPPVPPDDLLPKLEREIELPGRGHMRGPVPSRLFVMGGRWRRLWLPVTGLGGAAAVLLAGLFLVGGGSGRSIAGAFENLHQVKSVRAIRYYRAGPGQHVTRDPRRGLNESPNFSTASHPANPLVSEEIWFRRRPAPPFENQMVTVRADETVWNAGNRELRVNRITGERSFRLNSRPLGIQALVAPVQAASRFLLQPGEPRPGDAALAPEVRACWLGECRTRGVSINGWKAAPLVIRVWLDEATELARRIEWISQDYLEVSPPWLEWAYDFCDFNEEFPDGLFDLELTEADAAQLGLRLEELNSLSPRAFSVHLDGEEGVFIEGKVKDLSGTRTITGTLPFVFVHDPMGATSIQLRCRDGQNHKFGIAGQGLGMMTWVSGIDAEVGPNGEWSVNDR